MLTLLGSLLGLLSNTFPESLKLFRDSQDRKHELAILDRQMEQQRLGYSQRQEEIQIAADIAENQALYSYANHPPGSSWVEGLQASVRPVITYAFFLVFAVVKARPWPLCCKPMASRWQRPCRLLGMKKPRRCLLQ
jgi:hypothetical protein